MLKTNIVRRARKQLTDADFKKAADQQVQLLSALALFVDVDASSKDERIRKSITDPSFFNEVYLPHYFSDEPADFHPELIEALTKYDEMVACTAFRGGAKSTHIFGEIIREACLHDNLEVFFRFLVYQLDSLDKAEMYTQRILVELQHNERIKADFGLRVSMDASRRDFIITDPDTHRRLARIVAFGAGQSMRGLVNEETRPDWIISEDLQDRESAESEKRTKKLIRILLNDNRPALVPKRYRFTVVGNVICAGSLMDELLHPKKHLAFIKLRYAAITFDKAGVRHATWASRFSLTELDKIREQIGDVAFLAEFMCEPVEQDGYYQEKRDIHHWKFLPRDLKYIGLAIMQVDPSFSETGDCTAIGIGIEYTHTPDSPDYGEWTDANGKKLGEGSYILILDIYNRQNTIDELIDKTYELQKKYDCPVIHVDGSVEQEIVFDKFFSQREKTDGRLPIVWQDFHESKDLRIRGLQPYMQRRRLLFPPRTSDDVNTTILQFLRYGKASVADDGPDMLAALVDNIDAGATGTGNVELM